MEDAPVILEELSAENGGRIGVLTLNAEKTLNSLTLEMVDLISDAINRWKVDTDIVCILIKGMGDRAFCAGGDVQALYRSAKENIGGPCVYAETFFEHEYRMDYHIHTCPKPVIAWGNGIVMGGGIGILSGCSHRIATQTTRMAMPEVTIALYPDVGGGWLFNRMPGQTGLFLALTGASFNSADALYIGIADYLLGLTQLQGLMEGLLSCPWGDTPVANHGLVDALLSQLETENRESSLEGNIERNRNVIDSICAKDNVIAVFEAINGYSTGDPWLLKARENLKNGSPLSAILIFQHLKRCRDLSLRQVFQAELVLSTRIVRYPEFAEGVRALLIDKDRNPKWLYRDMREVPRMLVDSFFQPPWAENPLADLE